MMEVLRTKRELVQNVQNQSLTATELIGPRQRMLPEALRRRIADFKVTIAERILASLNNPDSPKVDKLQQAIDAGTVK